MKLRLDQSIPWSEEEAGGFAISAILSSVIFTALMAWVDAEDGTLIHPLVLGLFMLLGIGLLNTPPTKHFPAFVQYLLCCVATGLTILFTPGHDTGWAVVGYALQQNWISVNPIFPIQSVVLTRYGAERVLFDGSPADA